MHTADDRREITLFADYVCPYSYLATIGLERVAGELGITVQYRAFELKPPATRKAHEATKHAATVGLGPAMHRAIFDAWFLHEADIGRIDVLVEIGGRAGLDALGLKIALDLDVHTEAVLADRVLADELEISGTPAYVAAGAVRLGALEDAQLRQWLKD